MTSGQPLRILLTGGGTAGHVNPALAIGRHLGGAEARYLFVGVRGRAEEQVVPREGIPIRFVRASGFPGARLSLALLRFIRDLVIGTLQALPIIVGFRPHLIVGTGGFASAPVVLASAILRRLGLSRARVFIHEQNVAPGKANRLAGRLADRVFVTFRETLEAFPGNAVLAGYPLRERIAPVPREEARAKLDFPVPAGRFVVFVFGGSQGARTVNRAVVDSLGHLLTARDRLFVIHGTGLFKSAVYDAAGETDARLHSRYSAEQRREIAGFYVARPYFHGIEQVYAVADLVVARAGAGTLNEIAALGLPAIVLPKSNLPGEHQVLNARSMARHGGADVIYEETVLCDGRLTEQIDGAALAERILSLSADPARLDEMAWANRSFLRRDALDEIARHIRAFAAGAPLPVTTSGPPDAAVPAPPCGAGALGALPTDLALLASLERTMARKGSAFRPEEVVDCPDDLVYLRNRAAALLTRSVWEQRNLGVKLIGLLGGRAQVPLLLSLLLDRRPVGWLKRALGGDFVQVGFIRRNVYTALARLGVVTPDVESAILDGFVDPYYEVRAEAARTAAALGDRLTRRDEIVTALTRLFGDRSIEVASVATEAAGQLGGAGDALPALFAMKDARYWKVRAAALKGIEALVERGQVADYDRLRREVADFVLTSTDFTPRFEIKAAYRQVMEAASEREGEGQ